VSRSACEVVVGHVGLKPAFVIEFNGGVPDQASMGMLHVISEPTLGRAKDIEDPSSINEDDETGSESTRSRESTRGTSWADNFL